MKTVFNWSDLKQFGVNLLTGEACGIGIRVLCDLDKRGRALVSEFFGLDPGMFAENWNTGGECSVMLPYSIIADLAVYAMLRSGCRAVITLKDRPEIHGAETQAELEQFKRIMEDENQYPKVERYYRAGGTAPGGMRNVHEMSGRIV
ncbi:MAG: hypothetical protein AMXMBFR13_06870 [Phycisphaerae bacterium]